MPTLTDVENAIVTAIAPTKPSGLNVVYMAGWPLPSTIKAAIDNGNQIVSVFPHGTSKKIPTFLQRQEFIDGTPSPPNTPGTQTLVKEVARQQQIFGIHIWADTPANRESIAEAIRIYLDDSVDNEFDSNNAASWLLLPHGILTPAIYKNQFEDDQPQNQGLYHRILMYMVEYPTVKVFIGTNACTVQVKNYGGQIIWSNFEGMVTFSSQSALVQSLTTYPLL